ncbi:MAG: hypothetical protein E7170_04745 [Firmicutes bacterium]|nr:hypothetical protein [Bacillota bacterium]
MNDKYLYFGDVCIDGKIQCEESYKVGLQLYNELSSIEKERIKRGKKAKASWELAHASETALKAFLIYTEFTKMPIFNNPITINRNNGDNRILIRREKDRNQNITDVYSTGFYPGYKDNNEIWKKLLDGRRDELTPSEQSMFSDGKSFSMIGNPKTLLTSIRQNALEGDFRLDSNFMINDPIHSYDFTKNISGHDLFAYLKISNPTIQGIINNELFLLGDKFDKLEKIIGILEGYGNDSIQNNISQENIYTNSLAFPNHRFNWITGEDVDNDDLKNILDFAKINLDLAEFKFPGNDVDKFEHIVNLDFSEYNNTVFNCLDPICKYYVKQYFTNEEINTIDSIAKMKRLNPSDIVMFVNMCVYYKYNIRVILDEKSQLLNFDKSEHANNLLIHTNNMKTYDANGTRKLEDSSIFTSNIENISKVIEKIKQEKSLQTETNSNDKNLEEIIKICETNKIIPNDIILKKTPEDVKKIIEICKNNKIEISGSIFRKSAEEIEKIIAICNANKIYPTRSMFLKNP